MKTKRCWPSGMLVPDDEQSSRQVDENVIQENPENRFKFNEDVFRLNLHILIERDEDNFTAHCLEFDIIADGETEKEAELTLSISIGNHLSFCFENNRLDKILNHAPKEYWEKFYFCSRPAPEPTHVRSWGARIQDTAKVVLLDIDARCLIYAQGENS